MPDLQMVGTSIRIVMCIQVMCRLVVPVDFGMVLIPIIPYRMRKMWLNHRDVE